MMEMKHPLMFEDGLDLHRFGFWDQGEAQLKAAADMFGIASEQGGYLPWKMLVEEAWETAHHLFERLENEYPEWWEPALRRGEALLGEGDVRGFACLDRAEVLSAPRALILPARLLGHLNQNNTDAAERQLLDAQGILPNWRIRLLEHRIWYQRAVLAYSRSDYLWKSLLWACKLIFHTRRALYFRMYVDRFCHAFPNIAWGWKLKRDLYERSRDIRRADFFAEREASRQLTRLNPKNPSSYEHYARSYIDTRYFRRAEQICRSGIQSASHSDALHILLGNALCGQSRFDEAIKTYASFSCTPELEAARVINQAALYLKTGNNVECQRVLEGMSETDQTHPFARALRSILDRSSEAVLQYQSESLLSDPVWARSERKFHGPASLLRTAVTGISHALSWKRDRSGERMDCAVCGNAGTRFRLISVNRISGFTIAQCESCGLVMANPMPSYQQLSKIYDTDYFEFDLERAQWFLDSRERMLIPFNYYARRFAWLDQVGFAAYEEALGSERSALDIGCSSGLMMFELERRGWTCAGLDISPEIVQQIREKGYSVYLGTVDSAALPENSFQFVHLAHVIEHVREPVKLLDGIRRCMVADGRLLLITPCLRTPPSDFAGLEWLNDPAHVYFYDKQSLLTLLTRSGFEPTAVHLPVGIQFETDHKRWRRELISPVVEDVLSEHDLGDVIWILARAI